ncbi:hypothetical protein ACFLR3_04295 [Campylobacterota bacterium]
MRNLLLLAITVSMFVFSGCSTKEVTGYTGPKEVSTYLNAPEASTQEVQDALTAQGFEILSVSKVTKAKMDVVVFTHPHLKTLANKPGRGFLAGSMRALINTKDKNVRITNPRYFTRAFLQDDYKLNDETPLLDALNKAFPTLTPSADKWEFDGLPDYQFMVSRPYYQDTIEIKEGAADELQATLEKQAKKNLIFKLELAEGRTLYGVNLGRRTMKFPDKIGTQNAALLPWMVLIENKTEDGKETGTAIATAMRADYYIAISYPLLDLMGFATIMTVPGAVIKDLEKYFK